MSQRSNVKHPKQRGKWWRRVESGGKGVNRKDLKAVADLNPHAHTGPSRLFQVLLLRARV